MVFSSPIFLGMFLPCLLGLYFLANAKARNYILLIASLLFYSWGETEGVFVMIAMVAVNVRLEFPDAIVPASLGVNDYKRLLAFRFFEVSLE